MKNEVVLSKELLDRVAEVNNLSPEAFYALLMETECEVDLCLAEAKMSQETAWDCYFCLLHECDLKEFWEARERILAKIDTNRYNPFLSKNPAVVLIARLRLEGNTQKAP